MRVIVSVKKDKDISEVESDIKTANQGISNIQVNVLRSLATIIINYPDTVSFEKAKRRLSYCEGIKNICEDFEVKLIE